MTTSHDLVPVADRHAIPIAKMRTVFRVDDVEKRLHKLPPKEHESLRATYERMLEKGPERFQVKPGGLPAMEHLYEMLPNFHEVLDDVKRQLALCHDSGDALEITPMLLLGPPGVGKTHFAREVAQLLGTGMGFLSMSSLTAGWVLSGASSQWKGARPGKVFETLVDGNYANPVMVVDEIDKARGEHAYDPLGANDERAIPEPILNRMNVYAVQMPDRDAARAIARRLYASIRAAHAWGERFEPEPAEATLERMSELAPREMRRAWMTGFGNAKLDGRGTVEVRDLPEPGTKRTPIGFVH